MFTRGIVRLSRRALAPPGSHLARSTSVASPGLGRRRRAQAVGQPRHAVHAHEQHVLDAALARAEALGYDRRAFKVMTYNVRGFYGENGLSSVGDVLQLIGDHNPDIICLQEFNARLAGQSDEFALLDEKYESAVFGRTQAPDSLYGAPLVILSKYRILRSDTVLTPSSSAMPMRLISPPM